jgi:hypothetical protein
VTKVRLGESANTASRQLNLHPFAAPWLHPGCNLPAPALPPPCTLPAPSRHTHCTLRHPAALAVALTVAHPLWRALALALAPTVSRSSWIVCSFSTKISASTSLRAVGEPLESR